MEITRLHKSFQDRYLNKLEIGFRLPGDLNLEDVWEKVLAARRASAEVLPLLDEHGRNFWFVNTKPLQAKLHHIDSQGKDSLYRLFEREIERELVLDSIIDEAWASNVIEGAYTTHKRAQDLVRNNLPPKDKNDLMMKNNYQAMLYLIEHRKVDFSLELICEIHRIITENTLEDQEHAGRFRDDEVFIRDKVGNVIFKPMLPGLIKQNMEILINWANATQEEDFIHPITKASIIHFYLAYVHPFFDGNGRTSRALFYFYLLKNRYDFFRYFSISAIIAKRREKYYKAIKDVEDYDNDVTYFLLYSSDIVLKSIDEITDKIVKKFQSDIISKRIDKKGIYLNKRQRKVIKYAIEDDLKAITTRKYQKIFKVSYGTARSDLNELVEYGLFKKSKVGKGFVYQGKIKEFLT